MASNIMNERKLNKEAIRIVQKDIAAQQEQGEEFFIDKEVYDLCYDNFLKETVDDASLSKFLLKFHPSIGPNNQLSLFGPPNSPGSKLSNLLCMGGDEYGYHLVYLALREDDKPDSDRTRAIEALERTAKQLGKKAPENLFNVSLSSMNSNTLSPAFVTPIQRATPDITSSSDETPQGQDQSGFSDNPGILIKEHDISSEESSLQSTKGDISSNNSSLQSTKGAVSSISPASSFPAGFLDHSHHHPECNCGLHTFLQGGSHSAPQGYQQSPENRSIDIQDVAVSLPASASLGNPFIVVGTDTDLIPHAPMSLSHNKTEPHHQHGSVRGHEVNIETNSSMQKDSLVSPLPQLPLQNTITPIITVNNQCHPVSSSHPTSPSYSGDSVTPAGQSVSSTSSNTFFYLTQPNQTQEDKSVDIYVGQTITEMKEGTEEVSPPCNPPDVFESVPHVSSSSPVTEGFSVSYLSTSTTAIDNNTGLQ